MSLWAITFESPMAQVPKVPIWMRAFAVNTTNVATGANGILEIVVDSWSTNAERQRLITTMVDGGQDKLLDALQHVAVKGRIRLLNWQGRIQTTIVWAGISGTPGTSRCRMVASA
jgi:hypothetical protein